MKDLFANVRKVGKTIWCNIVFSLLVPTVCLFTMEWLHRGTLSYEDFGQWFVTYLPSYLLAWLLLVAVYAFISHASGWHWLATLVVALVTNVAGVACWYKLQMRGEPFLPWDFSQIKELATVAGKVHLRIEAPMWWTIGIVVLLVLCSCFVSLPYSKEKKLLSGRAGGAVLSGVVSLVLIFGVFLQTNITPWFGIYPDSWMQDRYYNTYGVVTGFLTNLTLLNVNPPENYAKKTVEEQMQTVAQNEKMQKPLYANSYGATASEPEKQPNIIYVMNESFWDLTRMDGIAYDRELTPNLTRLREESATGLCFTPSFGGGTCDVEFEALTGFSVEHLPAGSKPYQQHVTHDMFSLPQYLRSTGYSTEAVHGYYGKFWSRNVAYPYLGIDKFISAENFVNPDKRRGFISDAEMTQRIIAEYENREEGKPLFLHAVTMQNHTTYSADRYLSGELVKIVEHPGFSAETLSQLQDFATGIHEADAALGTLVDYFSQVDEPTIIVFWGDHFNPVGENYELYEKTGWIEPGEHSSPNLHATDLLIWSNYDNTKIDLGTLSAYNISPVMMDLYGLDMPSYFEFLLQQIPLMRGHMNGVGVQPDNTYSTEMTQPQQNSYDTQWLLQYDYMFGEPYQNDYVSEKQAKKAA